MRRIGADRGEEGVVCCPASGPASSARRRGEAVEQLERLFDESYDSILRYCAIRTGSQSVAEDVAAATFADAARSAASEGAVEVDLAWLYMVARRRLVDHWRSAERHRKRIRRLVAWRAAGSDNEPGIDPTSDRVHRALASLPDRQRALLTLRYLDDCSVSEVAEVFELSYSAAESALARARKSFVAAWGEVQ